MLTVRSVFLLSLLTIASPGFSSDDQSEFFREQVEPILRKRCYECHSHASGKMESGLTLDWRTGWSTGGDRGPAIIAGDTDTSLLIRAVRHLDDDLKMPEEKLPDSEIAILSRWVEMGAFDPRTVLPDMDKSSDWWSLKALSRPEVPANSAEHPIDAFIIKSLEANGLHLAPEADRTTLMRRMTIDLHGIQPTPEDVEAFVQDEDPRAVEYLVDRLLASPRYGERWARHWLDTIHFADSHGYEHDVFRPNAWPFRDYVIDSFNADKPWATFVREQIAADYLYPISPQLTPALGFLGAGTYDHSAASTAPMAYEYLDRDDLVTQTMAALVSTTANCARCHAHKFDPITQEDYFSLQAVFAGIGKGDIAFDADSGIAASRSHWKNLSSVTGQQHDILETSENVKLVSEWEHSHQGSAVWRNLQLDAFVSSDGADLRLLPDGSILSSGPRPESDTLTIVARSALPKITAVRLDLIPDDALPAKGPGRAENGNLHLSEFELQVFLPGATEGKRIAFQRASADFNQDGWTIQHAIDGKMETAWGIHPAIGAAHYAVFELESPLVLDPDATISVILKQRHGRGHIIGRFMLTVTDAPPETTIVLPVEVQTVLAIAPSQRTVDQQHVLAAAILRQIADYELRRLPAKSKVYAAAPEAENERGLIRLAEPRVIHVLKRGDLEQPSTLASPGALSAIRTLPARFELANPSVEASRRAALAEWIVDLRNPLTYRSIANRVWHYHFGKGLCDTPNDFGHMGSEPSHPELLDWLACEFRDSGGSLKHLHRLICTSATYRQSGAYRDDAIRIDPENRLLARMPRQRIDADTYRDSVLQVSGQLDLTMHGPGIAHFSTSPGAQLTPVVDYSHYDFDSMGATRRSIYRVVWRGIPDPFMEALDFPDLGLLAPIRGFSASALQSLVLLNDRFVLHQSEHMARRAKRFNSRLDRCVDQAVRWAWLREPTTSESQQLVALANERGLEAVCRLLLNSNEFLFVE